MKLSARFSSWFVLLMFVLSFQLSAQWSTNPAVNNAISTAASSKDGSTIVSDGAGGAIITWSDFRTVFYSDIYAQRINASGTVQWTTDGVAICIAADDQSNPTIVSDGSGGAIITWFDYRDRATKSADIYAQRINASGVVQWTTDGVAICTATSIQTNPKIVGDGTGGAIITWYDYRTGVTTNYDIYAQRINVSGLVQWIGDGVAICTATAQQQNPTIVGDGTGGAIITWEDFRSGGIISDIYAQRLNIYGIVQWTPDGVAICTETSYQFAPKIVGDGTGGAIVTWHDLRSGVSYDIYAQRINVSGTVQWTANGVAICTEGNSQFFPTIAGDGTGGAFISWYDERNGNYDIYAQRINASGTVQWTADGVAICAATENQQNPKIISDGTGGAIITWIDYRYSNYDTYAQRINATGTVQWTVNGVAISTALSNQLNPAIVSDGTGGAIIEWSDGRNGTSDIYAQRVDHLGNLYPAPWIDKAGDVANDQGGKLRILWKPSSLDTWGNTSVKSYTIKLGAKTTGILGKESQSNGTGIYWQTAGTVTADWSEGYTTAVATVADSGLQGKPMYYFQVIAKNADSTVWWYSNIDSGYSVDNIPPVGVANAMIASNGGGIVLKWNKNRVDKDLMEYRIYRSTTAGFMIGSGTELNKTTDTTFTDAAVTNGTTYNYRIAATDIHGNVGSPSSELSQVALAVELTTFTVKQSHRTIILNWKTATETNNSGFEIEKKRMKDELGKMNWEKIGFVEGGGTTNAPREYSYTDLKLDVGKYSYRLKLIDNNGAIHFSQEVEAEIAAPKEFALAQNYPNPFNPTTNIEFTVPLNGQATLKVFNSLGEEVATLFNGEAETGKYHQVQFNAAHLASGIYFARLVSGEKFQVIKLILLR